MTRQRRASFISIISIFIAILVCGTLNSGLADVTIPALKARVNDYAGILSSQTVNSLESQLASLEQTDSTQIVVLTVPSLEGEPIETYAIKVAEAWKIGQKGTDNGAILVISKNDRKMRIEVGYGLEGRLTDLISGQIIRNIIAPEFKQGNFDQGVLSGVAAMIGAVRGEFKGTPQHRSTDQKSGKLLFPLILFMVLVSQLGRFHRTAGTIAGGIFLPVFGSMLFSQGILFTLVLIPLGLVAGFILSIFGPLIGSMMFYGGGGFRGGGGSGGGFDGFSGGGGGFGGGGSSGGW